MSKKSRFRGPFNKQHGKSTRENYKIHHITFIMFIDHCEVDWIDKNSLLLIWKSFGLLVNTSAVDERYSVLNKDNFTIQSQMQIYQKY